MFDSWKYYSLESENHQLKQKLEEIEKRLEKMNQYEVKKQDFDEEERPCYHSYNINLTGYWELKPYGCVCKMNRDKTSRPD